MLQDVYRSRCISIVAMIMALSPDCQLHAAEPVTVSDAGSAGVLHPVFRDGAWGYIDNRGSLVVEPHFDVAYDFFEQRAGVEVGRRAGYIRPNGSWAVELPEGSRASSNFSEGLAWFANEERLGCVDSNGQMVVEPFYDAALPFSEGLAAVMRGPRDDDADGRVETAGRWGYVDTSGSEALPLEYSHAGVFRDGLARISIPGETDFKYVNPRGEVVLSLDENFTSSGVFVGAALDFSNCRAAIYFDGEGPCVPFAGFIDPRGKLVRGATYDSVQSYSEGLAAIRVKGKVGYINGAGCVVIPPKFSQGGSFQEGYCRVKCGRGWLYADYKGRRAAYSRRPGETWNDAEDFHGGLARVHVGGEFEVTDDGPARWRGGGWYYVDRSGRVVALCRQDGEGGRTLGSEF